MSQFSESVYRRLPKSIYHDEITEAIDMEISHLSGMKPGTAVNLIAGGCLMTVASVEGTAVSCDWFDEHQQLRHGTFQWLDLQQWIPVLAFHSK